MATIGTLITATNFNSVLTSVTSILSTYYGGVVTAQAVTGGVSTIARNDWANLQADINRCLIHQTNNGISYPAVNTGTLITAAYVNSLTNSATTIWNGKANVGSNQLLASTVNGVSARTTTWASDIQHQVQSYWSSSNDAAYFFQQGGYIKPTLSRNTGFSATTANTAWAALIDLVLADPDYVNYKYSLSNYNGTLAAYTKTDGTNTITIQFTKNNSQLITTDIIFNPLVSYLAIDVLPTSTVSNYYSTDSLGGTLAPRPAVQTSIPFNAGGALLTKTLTYDFVTPVTLPALGSTTTSVTVNNLGNSTCTITALAFGAQSGSGLTATFSPSSFVVDPSGSTSFSVTVFGSVRGTYPTNYITVTSDNDAGAVQIPIGATVTSPVFAVTVTPPSITSAVTNYSPVSTAFSFDPGVTGTIASVAASLSNTTRFAVTVTQEIPGYYSRVYSDYLEFYPGTPASATLTFTPPRVASGVDNTNLTLTFTPEDPTQSPVSVVVPVSYTTTVVNQHLGDWISAKNYYNGVIGFSYDIIEGVRTLTVGFGMGSDGSPQVVDGGAIYASTATLGLSADLQSSLGIPMYPYTNGNYNNFLNIYGSWIHSPGGTGRPGSFTNTYNFTVPSDGTYWWAYSVDNYGSIYIDGQLQGSIGNIGAYIIDTIYLTAGTHTITITATNTGGPGAVAATITASSDLLQNIYWSTRVPVRTTPAYQYWCEAYRIPLTQGAATYQSKDYCVKKTDLAAGTNHGTWASNGNICTVSDNGTGNLSITINPWGGTATGYNDVNQTIVNLQYLPYYYSEAESRINQLESPVSGQTKFFLGFDNQGVVRTSQVTFPAPLPLYGDGGGGGGGGCPDPTTPILTSATSSVPAGSLVVGDYIYTMHETTKEFGNFKVIKADIWQQPKLRFVFADNTEVIVSESHRFLFADDTWNNAINVSVGTLLKGIDGNKKVTNITSIGVGPVVKFEIEDAHTYISAGIISHNVKMINIDGTDFTYSTDGLAIGGDLGVDGDASAGFGNLGLE
jgi:hypothetical protein